MSNIEIKPSKDQRRFGPLRRTMPGKPVHPGHTPTKPWNLGNKNPWSMDMMRLAKARPGFKCKWVSKHKIEQALLHGYQFARADHYGVDRKIIGESNKHGDKIVRRELTLMEIPM